MSLSLASPSFPRLAVHRPYNVARCTRVLGSSRRRNGLRRRRREWERGKGPKRRVGGFPGLGAGCQAAGAHVPRPRLSRQPSRPQARRGSCLLCFVGFWLCVSLVFYVAEVLNVWVCMPSGEVWSMRCCCCCCLGFFGVLSIMSV